MSKKKLDIYEQQKFNRRQARLRAATLKECHPQLAKLTVDMSFRRYSGDPSDHDPDPKQELYAPESKAFFELECPHRECVDGGFDLSSVVSKMVAENETEASGMITCQGWQDESRIGKHKCMLEMNYNITANY